MRFFYYIEQLAYGGEAIGKDTLTIKQQVFADAYIELGNGTQAYLKAYPNVKREETARANSSRLLTNANVKSYIEERMAELASERIADQQEILELLTSVLRGEEQSAVLRGIGEGAQTIDDTMPPTTAERIKAAELLGKRYRMWTDKIETDNTDRVVIVDDV